MLSGLSSIFKLWDIQNFMKKKKVDSEAVLIGSFILILCLIMYFRVSQYYDHTLEGTKLQTPRYR